MTVAVRSVTFLIGRTAEAGPTARIGQYRAGDGSAGAPLALDVDGPHAAVIVGKRGYGKSYTLGVLAEELAKTAGIAPIIIDPMGVFETLACPETEPIPSDTPLPATVHSQPQVDPTTLAPRTWCLLLSLSPEGGAGGLIWQAASECDSLAAMQAHIERRDVPHSERRAAVNHLSLAASWGIFDKEGLDSRTLGGSEATVIDLSGLSKAAMNAVVHAIAGFVYESRVTDEMSRLPWLLLDEAHVFFDGIAAPALRTLLTRGRAPGVSLVVATQRPNALPAVALSQADIICAHRLTAQPDIDALERIQPTYLDGNLLDLLPERPGDVVIVDDATESVHPARIRSRQTPHSGESPRVSKIQELPELGAKTHQ